MSIGFDPLAFLTALFAIWFAYTETKKSNNILVKILQCKYTARGSRSENRGQIFSELLVVIRNQGISLHDPIVSLNFREKTGHGWLTMPLKRRDERTGQHTEFARGMIAEFSLKSYELDPDSCQFLEKLVDMAQQEPRFSLYSQGYLVKEFPVTRLRYRLAVMWNSLAYRFNRLFDRKVGTSGVKQMTILPENFLDLSIPLRCFIQYLRPESMK